MFFDRWAMFTRKHAGESITWGTAGRRSIDIVNEPWHDRCHVPRGAIDVACYTRQQQQQQQQQRWQVTIRDVSDCTKCQSVRHTMYVSQLVSLVDAGELHLSRAKRCIRPSSTIAQQQKVYCAYTGWHNKNGATISLQIFWNSMTELRGNYWWTSAILYAEHSH